MYAVELANSLNDPEGFLIQARNGTDTSSEIIGTFLDPTVVRARNPSALVNYKILSCNQRMDSMEPLLPVSMCFKSSLQQPIVRKVSWFHTMS